MWPWSTGTDHRRHPRIPGESHGTPGFPTVQEIEREICGCIPSATGALYLVGVVVPEQHGDSARRLVSALKAPLSCLTQAHFGIAWGVIGALGLPR